MNSLYIRRLLSFLILALLVVGTCNAQSKYKSGSRNPEKSLFGKNVGSKKRVKIKEPKAVHKAKKKQEKNERRLKKEYDKQIEQSRKRSYNIQSPEVKERMRQNQKDTNLRDKEKKKRAKSVTKNAARKYT